MYFSTVYNANGDQLGFICTAPHDFVTGKTHTRGVPDYNYCVHVLPHPPPDIDLSRICGFLKKVSILFSYMLS
jgi:hypothetical protein